MEEIINQVAQNKIGFSEGLKFLLENEQYNFEELFTTLKNYIFNAIPNKTDYNSETYQSTGTIDLGSDAEIRKIYARFDRKGCAGQESSIVVGLVVIHVDTGAVDSLAQTVSGPMQDLCTIARVTQNS